MWGFTFFFSFLFLLVRHWSCHGTDPLRRCLSRAFFFIGFGRRLTGGTVLTTAPWTPHCVTVSPRRKNSVFFPTDRWSPLFWFQPGSSSGGIDQAQQPLPNGKSCQSEPPHGILTTSHSVKHSHRLHTKEQITQKSHFYPTWKADNWYLVYVYCECKGIWLQWGVGLLSNNQEIVAIF